MSTLDLVTEAMSAYRPFKVSKKNIDHVVAVCLFSEKLTLNGLVSRIVLVYGGCYITAVVKVAQSLLAGAITINNDGFVEVVNG